MSATPIWRTRRTGRREASRGTERLPRIGVKRPPVALPVTLVRGHARDAAEQADHGPLDVALDGGEPITYVLEAVPDTPARDVFADLIQACIG